MGTMVMRSPRWLLGLVVLTPFATGCYQEQPWGKCAFGGCEVELASSGGEDGEMGTGLSMTTTASPTTSMTTGEPTGGVSVTISGGSTGEGSTSGGVSTGGVSSESSSDTSQELAPTILGMTLTPNELLSAGIVRVEVETLAAQAVTFSIDMGQTITLSPVEDQPSFFTGEFTVFGSSWNGEHAITAIATNHLKEESAPWTEQLMVSAPPGGSEGWQVTSPLAPSYGNAVVAAGQGDTLELFTHATPQGQECYLRRRNKLGQSVWLGDARWIAVGEDCTGEDVKLAPDGTIWVLVNVFKAGVGRWQLWHLDEKGLPLAPDPQVGTVQHLGRGLDVNAAGDVLLCGTLPGSPNDEDAWLQLRSKDKVSWMVSWDHLAANKPEAHVFSERVQDCSFVGDRFVAVGQAWGEHETGIDKKQNRGFVLEYGAGAVKLAEVVAPSSYGWHSSFRALAADGQGGYATAGSICSAMVTPCNTTIGRLWWFSQGGTKIAERSLPLARDVLDVAHSPAGYFVAAGQTVTGKNGFLVQGWAPNQALPVLSYQANTGDLHVANGVAVDPIGFIVAGGYFVAADNSLVAGVTRVNPS